MKNKLLILLLFIADAYLKELKIPISPCPDIFHYAYDGTEVYGIFNFEGAELNKIYNLKLHMVYEDTVYIKGKGKLALIEDQESALLNITRNKPVSYKIKFPIQTEIPEVTEIYMNNILLCFNEDSIEQSNTQIIYHNIFTTFGLTKYKSFTDFADPDFLRSQAK
uniref:Serine protease gd N-terminal domain-containing protein n=1 Tax=Megaselia scalaris TaxID=36166 RepID=T1GEN2_MEGSC